eukprot:PhF_6_TR27811/c0_g1_i1/m.40556
MVVTYIITALCQYYVVSPSSSTLAFLLCRTLLWIVPSVVGLAPYVLFFDVLSVCLYGSLVSIAEGGSVGMFIILAVKPMLYRQNPWMRIVMTPLSAFAIIYLTTIRGGARSDYIVDFVLLLDVVLTYACWEYAHTFCKNKRSIGISTDEDETDSPIIISLNDSDTEILGKKTSRDRLSRTIPNVIASPTLDEENEATVERTSNASFLGDQKSAILLTSGDHLGTSEIFHTLPSPNSGNNLRAPSTTSSLSRSPNSNNNLRLVQSNPSPSSNDLDAHLVLNFAKSSDNCHSLLSDDSRKSSRVLRAGDIDQPSPVLPMVKTVNWRKGNILGSGAFATVHVGLNLDTGEMMAVKHIEFDPIDVHLERKLRMLQNEIQILKKLNHANIVKYFFLEKIGDGVNIFMEYVPGGSLLTILKNFGALSEIVVVQYTYQLLLGLAYLHKMDVVHGDIKSANILISVDGNVKLADFGAATLQQERSNQHQGGTPLWMAPEVVRGETQESAWPHDIWALGCTVMEMLTGKLPWAHIGGPMEVMQYIANPDSMYTFPPGLKHGVLNFLKDCLQPDPNNRPTAEQLLNHHFF